LGIYKVIKIKKIVNDNEEEEGFKDWDDVPQKQQEAEETGPKEKAKINAKLEQSKHTQRS
jgi:hypothetical protein